ncbi:Uncharacterised protein [Serratia liquefaciens]|uniref:hypothetical protein n=1 Tax=Serratia liquefaciens TaxID=614 RepID=UPI00217B07C4|nr:hypothetical protein [Serratia liquefaciens]CAI1998488.1 Uncharacterised protein [Serratia liquefaciens]
MSNFRTVLLNAFTSEHRDTFTRSVAQAYIHSAERSREFGLFSREAQPYLRWFFCEALLEKAAITHGLSYLAASNAAGNCRHLTITSKNWSLTTHHVNGPGQLPRKARYRAMYVQSKNYELFEPIEQLDNVVSNLGGYAYLLHDGKGASLEAISLTIPTSDLRSVLYTESLDLVSPYEAEEEAIEDELNEKIALRVEDILRSKK